MRKSLSLLMIFSFILCSCSANKPIPSESSPISTSSEIISTVSSKSTISTVSKSVSTVSSASVLKFYDIPTENGDEISYSTAIKISDRIYAGSKNKVISFNEDLSDIQVLYEHPDQKFFVKSILQIDENTIYVCFSEDLLIPTY